MATAIKTTDKLMTIEEFAAIPPDGRLRELVKGRVVEMNVPKPKHGFICLEIGAILREFVKPRRLGRVFTNDSGVITERDPDSLREPDVGYYSYARVPAGKAPDGYYDAVPEIAFEVMSPGDVWARVLEKVAELLDAYVTVVCVADPRNEAIQVHHADLPVEHKRGDDELTFPDVLPGFSCKASQCFDV